MLRSSLPFLAPASVAVTVCLLAPGVRAEGQAAPTFEPDLARAGELVLQGQTWTRNGPTYGINLRPVDDRERLTYIRRTTGLEIDPFATPPGRVPRFLSFLLVIENSGEADLQFNPIHCWLMTNRKQIESPLGLADLGFSYHVAGREFPTAYERVAPALFEHPRAVKPGESVSGLLVYHAIEPKTKRYHVDVELTLPSGDVVAFAAPYRRVGKGRRSREN